MIVDRSGSLLINPSRKINENSNLFYQLQCSGEAKYAEDIPNLPNEVYGAFVLSTVALGTIASIDASAALVSKSILPK